MQWAMVCINHVRNHMNVERELASLFSGTYLLCRSGQMVDHRLTQVAIEQYDDLQ